MGLTVMTIPGQSGPGSNENESVLNIPLIFIIGVAKSDAV